jgi:hypothetical protein
MHVPRLPRRLLYNFPGGGETEYPTDIPTPQPEIKTESVQVPVPPPVPQLFKLHAVKTSGEAIFPPNALCQFWSWRFPDVRQVARNGGQYFQFEMIGQNMIGQEIRCGDSFGAYLAGTGFVSPGATLRPRCDLLIGSDRLINPTVDTPCPTWRFTGGNCPPNSLGCGNCCLDCASTTAGIDGVTALVLPISTWRKR